MEALNSEQHMFNMSITSFQNWLEIIGGDRYDWFLFGKFSLWYKLIEEFAEKNCPFLENWRPLCYTSPSCNVFLDNIISSWWCLWMEVYMSISLSQLNPYSFFFSRTCRRPTYLYIKWEKRGPITKAHLTEWVMQRTNKKAIT